MGGQDLQLVFWGCNCNIACPLEYLDKQDEPQIHPLLVTPRFISNLIAAIHT